MHRVKKTEVQFLSTTLAVSNGWQGQMPLFLLPRFFLEPVLYGEEEYRDLRMSLQFHRRMPEDACIFTDTVPTETKDRDHRHSNGFPRSLPVFTWKNWESLFVEDQNLKFKTFSSLKKRKVPLVKTSWYFRRQRQHAQGQMLSKHDCSRKRKSMKKSFWVRCGSVKPCCSQEWWATARIIMMLALFA